MKKSFLMGALSCVAVLSTSCVGVPLAVDGGPIRPGETAIGQAEGKGTGIMLFQIIPIGQNTRGQTAYDRALASVPGAKRIADLKITESWFWAYVLNGYTTTIQGTAVK